MNLSLQVTAKPDKEHRDRGQNRVIAAADLSQQHSHANTY